MRISIAPLSPEDGDYLMRMLARVEGMPLESLQNGVPWDWRTTAEYLDRLDGTLLPNAGRIYGEPKAFVGFSSPARKW